MRSWVSFTAIKRAVSMEAVLELYRWQGVQRRGHHVQGPCPIHRGQRRDAFHADLQRHIFHSSVAGKVGVCWNWWLAWSVVRSAKRGCCRKNGSASPRPGWAAAPNAIGRLGAKMKGS